MSRTTFSQETTGRALNEAIPSLISESDLSCGEVSMLEEPSQPAAPRCRECPATTTPRPALISIKQPAGQGLQWLTSPQSHQATRHGLLGSDRVQVQHTTGFALQAPYDATAAFSNRDSR
jgi:hypothetical protein